MSEPAAPDAVAETTPSAPPPVERPPPVFYRIDGSKATFSEFRRSATLANAIAAWLLVHLFRVKGPFSTDDPCVETLASCAAAELPKNIQSMFERHAAALTALGFHSPTFNSIQDQLHSTGTYLATFAHASLPVVARLHLRLWAVRTPPKPKLFTEFISQFPDGEFLWTLSGNFDTEAPPSCRVIRRPEASIAELWALHQRELAADRRQAFRVPDADSAAEIGERLHESVRDFHLSRGFFVPRSDTDEATVAAAIESRRRAKENGSKFPGVLVALDRLQNQKSGSGAGAVVLVISLALFLLIGSPGAKSYGQLLVLVPILFFHELGHFAAMKLCGYRNLRMFFIPGFGAAVTGRAFNVPGWKKVFVSLMGPVPGIALGIFVGLCGLLWSNGLAVQAGLLLVVLNGINLLPVLPLDGGHVLHAVLFSRHVVLDAIFRLGAAAGLVGLGLMLNTRVFYFLALILVLNLPQSVRLARVAQRLRRAGIRPVSPDNQSIPADVAEQIVEQLKLSAARPQPDRLLAQQTLQVFEALNSHPPGWLASTGLLSVHVLSLLAAVVFTFVFVLGRQGSLPSMMRAAARAPRHTLTASAIRSTPAKTGSPVAPATPAVPSSTVVATFAKPDRAAAAYQSAVADLTEGESVAQFGDTVLVRLRAGDDAGRGRWLDRLQPAAADAFVCGPSMHAAFRIQALAPSEQTAKALSKELSAYFSLPLAQGLVAPWSPTQRITPEQRRARDTYMKLERGDPDPDHDLDALRKKMESAQKRGDQDQYKSLLAELRKRSADRRRAYVERLGQDTSGAVDTEMVREYLALFDSTKPQAFYLEIGKRLAPRMGQVTGPTAPPGAPAPDPTVARTGFGSRTSLLVQLEYLEFDDPAAGAAAVANWLSAKGCTMLRYDVSGTTADGEDEEPEPDGAPDEGG